MVSRQCSGIVELLATDNWPLITELGGADRDRTGGLLVANQALSQLSYSPLTAAFSCQSSAISEDLLTTEDRRLTTDFGGPG